MSYSQSRPGRSRKAKTLTDYPMSLAFERIEFYLRVLEAHFDRLGVDRRVDADRRYEAKESRGLSRAAAEGG